MAMEISIVKSKGYNIYIGSNCFDTVNTFLSSSNYSSYFIICDENTMNACLPDLVSFCPKLRKAAIIEIESGEAGKSIEFCTNIWQTLFESQADKQSLILNLGGGVVSDLGGFIASVYKRGIDFINIPTSLLAMVDASVGGKTGINFDGLKNAIGTITQPKAVFINPDFLKTLSGRHFKNGLAEVYKTALISDQKFWESLKTIDIENNTEFIITKSVKLKNRIVLKDPFENGLRKILNFGHTIGHALEALWIDQLLHGEAIVIGMIMESHIAWQKKLISKAQLAEISDYLNAFFRPAKINDASLEAILELIKNDKKNSGNKFRFALPDRVGNCRFDVEVSEAQVKKSIEYYRSL